MLLASEERAFSHEAIDLAAKLAVRSKARMHVLAIARVWGTSFGFPSPGLQPTRQEWDTQREHVRKAVNDLRRTGLQVTGEVLGTRRATRSILRRAEHLGCDAIVMGADAERGAFVGDFVWSQEPYRVARRASVPVYLVTDVAGQESRKGRRVA